MDYQVSVDAAIKRIAANRKATEASRQRDLRVHATLHDIEGREWLPSATVAKRRIAYDAADDARRDDMVVKLDAYYAPRIADEAEKARIQSLKAARISADAEMQRIWQPTYAIRERSRPQRQAQWRAMIDGHLAKARADKDASLRNFALNLQDIRMPDAYHAPTTQMFAGRPALRDGRNGPELLPRIPSDREVMWLAIGDCWTRAGMTQAECDRRANVVEDCAKDGGPPAWHPDLPNPEDGFRAVNHIIEDFPQPADLVEVSTPPVPAQMVRPVTRQEIERARTRADELLQAQEDIVLSSPPRTTQPGTNRKIDLPTSVEAAEAYVRAEIATAQQAYEDARAQAQGKWFGAEKRRAQAQVAELKSVVDGWADIDVDSLTYALAQDNAGKVSDHAERVVVAKDRAVALAVVVVALAKPRPDPALVRSLLDHDDGGGQAIQVAEDWRRQEAVQKASRIAQAAHGASVAFVPPPSPEAGVGQPKR